MIFIDLPLSDLYAAIRPLEQDGPVIVDIFPAQAVWLAWLAALLRNGQVRQ
jgi:hypothetical protein